MTTQETTIFTYSDIIFSFFLNDDSICTHKAIAHLLIYVYSGKLSITENGEEITATSGECVFVRRDHRVTITKGAYKEEQFRGITMKFNRSFLRDYYSSLKPNNTPKEAKSLVTSVVQLPKVADVDSLFLSLTPYFHSTNTPNDELMQMKLREGIMSLLSIDSRFYATLFDFTEPFKIDILDFLENNYMYDLSLDEIASYTGRSLASFKRDFKKISDLSPQKWIIQKRLNVAYDKIKREGVQIADICFEVGFKNRSHFTTAFKKQFGFTPAVVEP